MIVISARRIVKNSRGLEQRLTRFIDASRFPLFFSSFLLDAE